jgi:hypothetical protein
VIHSRIARAGLALLLAWFGAPAPAIGEGAGTVPVSAYILIDQFGYLPSAQKVAVIRDPQTGYDAAAHFVPGARYAVIDSQSGARVAEGPLLRWRGGAVDASSGDRAFWFDFSAVTRPGRYFILDLERRVRSQDFAIADDVYRNVLRAALRTFFYQRAGFAKTAAFAGAGWADGASHLGPGQDRDARLYSAPDDARTARDLSGGWYDAGDYNRYTSWSARYVVMLLNAYQDNPAAFTDDDGIPESGNGTPDVIDEVRWGLDWLVRMQNADGSVLSVLSAAQASPPSAATGPSLYGKPSTSATFATAAAFARGARVFRDIGQGEYADDLLRRAKRAYGWAEANPAVLFKNNDAASGTKGLAAGQQEVGDDTRLSMRVEAAVYLFDATGEDAYRAFVDRNYARMGLIARNYASPFEAYEQDVLLFYTTIPSSSLPVATAIRDAFARAMASSDNLGAVTTQRDPYRAYLKDYTWGSNSTKAAQGHMLSQLVKQRLVSGDAAAQATSGALGYINYLHGVNPFGLVYLTNMSSLGAGKSVKEMFHAWFKDGSPRWDRVGASTFGPPPGFLVGGPNPAYRPDRCCPAGCGLMNNSRCTAEPLKPPLGQPPQKAFKEFNADWPLNSWEVTENSNAYQAIYIRLLSQFVE